MFGKRITLFRLVGFEVRIDVSWVIVALLITWSLAGSVFPARYEGLSVPTYWWMGIAGAIGLFLSVVVHELSHSIVARRFGLPMRGITLFIFGGVAEMAEEPPSAKAEFFMAIAGPLASVAIAGIGFAGARLAAGSAWPTSVLGVLDYLWSINLLLAAFNLIPAFPLDGGRVLRSALWGISGRIGWSTRIASGIGSAFGLAVIFFGIYSFFRGDLIGGIWLFLIGNFLRGAAQAAYQQLVTQRVLTGEPVRRFMVEDPVTVPYGISVEQLVEEYIYRHHHQMYPVLQGDELVGCVSARDVKRLPREEWPQTTVKALSTGCSEGNTISPGADAAEALALMRRTGNSRLMVVEDGRLVGVLTLKDLLTYLSLKTDLEGARIDGA